MSYALSHLVRAQAYADDIKTSLVREDPFGYGMDGTVWRTVRHSVVKVCEHNKNYDDELECYQRLVDVRVEDVSGFKVPGLLGFHDKLKAGLKQDVIVESARCRSTASGTSIRSWAISSLASECAAR